MTVKVPIRSSPVYKPTVEVLYDRDRKATDFKYSVGFIFIYIIWITSCIYAFFCSENNSPNSRIGIVKPGEVVPTPTCMLGAIVQWAKDIILFCRPGDYDFDWYYLERGQFFFVVSILVYSAMLLIGLALMVMITLSSPPVVIISSFITIIVLPIYQLVKINLTFPGLIEPFSKQFFYWISPLVLNILILLYCYMQRPKESLRKAFRYYFACRNLLVFGFLTGATVWMFHAFTARILMHLSLDSIKSKIIFWTIYSGSGFMILLTYIFSRVVISAGAAAYYWDLSEDTAYYRKKCLDIPSIVKYKFGTICCKTIYTAPCFIVMLILCNYEFKFDESIPHYFRLFLVLVFTNVDYSVSLIGMFGLSRSDANRLYFYVQQKTRKMIGVTFIGIFCCMFMIWFSGTTIMLIMKWAQQDNNQKFSNVLAESNLTVLICVVPIIFLFAIIDDARCICRAMENRVMKVLEENVVIDFEMYQTLEVKLFVDSILDSAKTDEQRHQTIQLAEDSNVDNYDSTYRGHYS